MTDISIISTSVALGYNALQWGEGLMRSNQAVENKFWFKAMPTPLKFLLMGATLPKLFNDSVDAASRLIHN